MNSHMIMNESINLIELPQDLLILIFSYLNLNEVEVNAKLTCSCFRKISNEPSIWKERCLKTGKIVLDNGEDSYPYKPNEVSSFLKNVIDTNNVHPSIFQWEEYYRSVAKEKIRLSHQSCPNLNNNQTLSYKELYYRNPCVPVDFNNIQDALRHCANNGTVTLLPGTYHDTIACNDGKMVNIRAAFPHIGAAIIHHQKHYNSNEFSGDSRRRQNEPCVYLTGGNTHLTVSHIQFLHASPGTDIWSGNCVALCDNEACLSLHDCTLQSDSGRGVVVTGSGRLVLTHCVVHDCAATGLYAGDVGTTCVVLGCNILENGFGSGRSLCRKWRRDESLAEEIDAWDSDEDEDDYDSIDDEREHVTQRNVVPPGHSGMYIETAGMILHDSMVSGNSLTGLSVVREGRVKISGSDITNNGADPVSVEEFVTVPPVRGRRAIGGIVLGPFENKFVDQALPRNGKKSEDEFPKIHGARIRKTTFGDSVKKAITMTKLKSKYSSS